VVTQRVRSRWFVALRTPKAARATSLITRLMPSLLALLCPVSMNAAISFQVTRADQPLRTPLATPPHARPAEGQLLWLLGILGRRAAFTAASATKSQQPRTGDNYAVPP